MSDRLPQDRRAMIAVDLGAESCRVSLLRVTGEQLRATLVHRFANGPVASPQGLHWPLAKIEQGVLDGLRRCAELAPEGIRSVAVDGWAVDYVRLNESGGACAPPFCYRDERTLAAEQAVHAVVSSDQLRDLTGVQMQRINTAYQLVADRQAGARPARWLMLPEYVLYRLGAPSVAELTNASHTQLVSLGRPEWCLDAFRLMNLDPALAAPIVLPGTQIGHVTGELAALAAFKATLLIAPACHDTASAIAGIPVREEEDDWAYISSGTWSLVGTLLEAPENGRRARAGNYTNLAAAGGATLFHKGLSGMWLLRQCMLHWSAQTDAPPELASLMEEVALLPEPEHLLDLDDADLMLPFDMPARISRHLEERGVQPLPRSAAAAPWYASLIFHSLAARYREVLEEIASITGKRFKRVYVVGGGSRNEFLNRLVARRTGLEVVRGPAESSTQGNFAVQLALLEDAAATAGNVARWAGVLASCCSTDGL